MVNKKRDWESTDPLDYYYEVHLFDPQQTNHLGHPKKVAVIGLRLNIRRQNVTSTRQLDAAIVEIMDSARRKTFLNGRGYSQGLDCCSRCGGAFEKDCCKYSIKNGISVPARVRTWLASGGLVFAV